MVNTTTKSLRDLSTSTTNSNLPFNGSTNYWTGQDDGETVSRHIGVKNQTVLVSLIIMGVVVPAIFIFMFVMLCLKHKRTQQSRRSTMLLRNGPEIPMEDISLSMRTNLENGRL